MRPAVTRPASAPPAPAGTWWDDLFDRRGSVRAVAVMRIALGPITLLHLRPFLRDARAGRAYDDHFWEPFLPWLPHLPGWLWFVLLWVGAAGALLMTIGLWTRVATATAFAAVAVNLVVDQTHFRHNRVFLAILLGGLALLPSGRVLSLDSWWRRRAVGAPVDVALLWPLWLLRAQVSLVYLASGTSKLVDSDWLGGLVLWDRVVRFRHVLDPTPLPAWAIDVLTSRWLYYGVGPAAVFTEVFIGLALWSARTRLAAIWVAVLFHLAIEISASVEVFSYAAIAALAIWVTPSTRDRVVIVDNSAAGRAMAWLLRLGDWFGRFRVEQVTAGAVTVIDRDGTRRTGAAGVVFVLSRLPLTLLVGAPLLLLTGRRRRATGPTEPVAA